MIDLPRTYVRQNWQMYRADGLCGWWDHRIVMWEVRAYLQAIDRAAGGAK